MLAKSSIILSVFALSASLAAAATPPACLLAAVNTQPNPADLKAVCGNATKVEDTISSICNDDVKPAMSAFSSVCSSAGVAVSTSAVSSTKSSTKTTSASASASASATGSITSTARIPLSTGTYGTGNLSPATIVYTSTYFDTVCSCTKTQSITTTGYAGSTGILTATYPMGTGSSSSGNSTVYGGSSSGSGSGSGAGSAAGASGSSAKGSASASSSAVPFTGAAGRVDLSGLAMGAIAIAGLAVGL
ncbi:hypothetical protein H2203_008289 [Taxawa tesnikishii (nom. ined.)]|nr:hypothetical protein H2203_008289 [Dothideales sp. JES 119]